MILRASSAKRATTGLNETIGGNRRYAIGGGRSRERAATLQNSVLPVALEMGLFIYTYVCGKFLVAIVNHRDIGEALVRKEMREFSLP
jgi:hypothetical protein